MRSCRRPALLALCVAIGMFRGQGALAADEPLPAGGLLVHVGCGTGGRTVKYVGQGEWLVHGLDGDWQNIEKARKLIQLKGLYGLVSVDHWTGRELPYADNIVNLLIARGLGAVSEKEALRVLAPGGAAKLGTRTVRKPRPKGMDGWPHRRRGADGNPVSRDTLVGPSREIRWVLGGGRHGLPLLADGKYYLGGVYTRDAFNGLPLWKDRMSFRAAGNGRLYGFAGGDVVALDARTGVRMGGFGSADGRSATILYQDGTLIVASRGVVRTHDAKTGRERWSVGAAAPRHVVAGDGRLLFIDGDPKRGVANAVVCLDLATGKPRWRTEGPDFLNKVSGCSYDRGLLVCEVSAFRDGGTCAVHGVSAKDGKHLWSHSYKPPMTHNNQARAYFLGRDLWVHQEGFTMLDRLTGRKLRTVPGGGGHCFPAIATVRYLMHGEMNFTDARTGKLEANRITKGGCAENPYIPANGLLYAIPKHRICFPMIHGYIALAPASRSSGKASAWARGGFDKGAAFGVGLPPDSVKDGRPGEWPMYRHDRFRSGGAGAFVRADLKQLWSAPVLGREPALGGMIRDDWSHHPYVTDRITSPVAAGGRVFVGIPHEHRVVALEARTGRPLWTFSANGIIDTPPTIHRGLCLFGTRSGWVYCLVAANGDMVWRLRAGPRDKRIVAWGGLESAWPVPGSVLAHDGIVYFAAGRHPLADGGVHVFAVQARTGKVVSHGVVDSVGIGRWYGRLGTDYEPVDLLVFDGEDQVAMSRARFKPGSGVTVNASAGGFYRALPSGRWRPTGMWSYGRSMRRKREKRILYVARGDTIYGGDGAVALILPDKHPGGGGREWTPFSYLNGLKKKWSGGVKGTRAMVVAGSILFVADGGTSLRAFSTARGKRLRSTSLGGVCVWDGIAVAYGRLYVSTRDGKVICLGNPAMPPPPPPTRAPPKAYWKRSAARPLQQEALGGRKAPREEVMAAWDAKLLARALEKHSAAAVELADAWLGLTLDDRKNLALAVVGDDEAGHALAAFYLLATGNEAEAGEHLRKAGSAAEEVRSAFRQE